MIGMKFNGSRHIVDNVATDQHHNTFLVSLKWQQSSGTAEQKIPFEVMCLMDAVQTSQGSYKRAYLVLGGDGWTLREYYISGDMNRFIPYANYVSIIKLETFVGKANKGQLHLPYGK